MKPISFQHTAAQILTRTKTVTRRAGWNDLKPGTVLQACERCRGLRKDERRELAIIRVESVRREWLGRLVEEKDYGAKEMRLEGFGDDPRFPSAYVWIQWYRSTFGNREVSEDILVTRIEFEYLDP